MQPCRSRRADERDHDVEAVTVAEHAGHGDRSGELHEVFGGRFVGHPFVCDVGVSQALPIDSDWVEGAKSMDRLGWGGGGAGSTGVCSDRLKTDWGFRDVHAISIQVPYRGARRAHLGGCGHASGGRTGRLLCCDNRQHRLQCGGERLPLEPAGVRDRDSRGCGCNTTLHAVGWILRWSKGVHVCGRGGWLHDSAEGSIRRWRLNRNVDAATRRVILLA